MITDVKGEKMKKQITKDMTINEILSVDSSLGEILLGFDMHCIFCPMGRMETLEEACQVHGADTDFVLKKLNDALNFSVKGTVKAKENIKKSSVKKI